MEFSFCPVNQEKIEYIDAGRVLFNIYSLKIIWTNSFTKLPIWIEVTGSQEFTRAVKFSQRKLTSIQLFFLFFFIFTSTWSNCAIHAIVQPMHTSRFYFYHNYNVHAINHTLYTEIIVNQKM